MPAPRQRHGQSLIQVVARNFASGNECPADYQAGVRRQKNIPERPSLGETAPGPGLARGGDSNRRGPATGIRLSKASRCSTRQALHLRAGAYMVPTLAASRRLSPEKGPVSLRFRDGGPQGHLTNSHLASSATRGAPHDAWVSSLACLSDTSRQLVEPSDSNPPFSQASGFAKSTTPSVPTRPKNPGPIPRLSLKRATTLGGRAPVLRFRSTPRRSEGTISYLVTWSSRLQTTAGLEFRTERANARRPDDLRREQLQSSSSGSAGQHLHVGYRLTSMHHARHTALDAPSTRDRLQWRKQPHVPS
jgi:hypothetical protein